MSISIKLCSAMVAKNGNRKNVYRPRSLASNNLGDNIEVKKRQHTPGITSLPGISIFIIYSIPGWTSEALDWILCNERKMKTKKRVVGENWGRKGGGADGI